MLLLRSLILLLFLSITLDTVAQKKKRGKNEEPPPVTAETLLKVETSIIEAEKQLLLENYVKAYELFLIALDLDPNSAAVHFKIAEVLLKSGDASKAIGYAERAIELDPSNKYYYLLAAEIYKGQNKLDKAAETYKVLMERTPSNDQYLFDLAIIYQFQNKFEKAIEVYNEAEEKFGLNEAVVREKQKIYLRNSDMQSLMDDWDRLIAKNKGESSYVLELANTLIANEMGDEAESRLLAYKKNELYDPGVDLLLSEIERKRGNIEKALALLEQPILSPDVEIAAKLQVLGGYLPQLSDAVVKESLVRYASQLAETFPNTYESQAFAGDIAFQSGEKEKAIDYYLRAIEIRPSNFGVWQNIVNLEAELQMYDSVVLHVERALEYFPNQAMLYYFGGFAHYTLNNFKRASQMLEQGVKYTTEANLVSVFYGQLGDVYNSMKNHSKSDESYETALKSNPSNDHVLNNYSYFLSLRKSKMDKALEMSSKLVALFPENPTYLDTHGWVLYVNGNFADALGFLKKAAELDPNDGTIVEHLGDVLFQLGDIEGALREWRKASDLEGTSELLNKKIAEKKLYE
ncbi:MAG: tetratricopeptide repeat protein [Cyclobacteriaceae bacterium]|nr:tetratricopeptide repeat protein [Cyclobacteriaceae bacterium HetDA_MAG_MS6]